MFKSIFNVFLGQISVTWHMSRFSLFRLHRPKRLKYDDSEKRNIIFLSFSFSFDWTNWTNVWMQIADVPHLVTSSIDNGAVWCMNVQYNARKIKEGKKKIKKSELWIHCVNAFHFLKWKFTNFFFFCMFCLSFLCCFGSKKRMAQDVLQHLLTYTIVGWYRWHMPKLIKAHYGFFYFLYLLLDFVVVVYHYLWTHFSCWIVMTTFFGTPWLLAAQGTSQMQLFSMNYYRQKFCQNFSSISKNQKEKSFSVWVENIEISIRK